MKNMDQEIEALLPMIPPMTRPRLRVLDAIATAGICRAWRWSTVKLLEFKKSGLIRRVRGPEGFVGYEITARGCRLLGYAKLWYGEVR